MNTDLVDRISRSWDALHESIDSLDAAALVEPDTDGWSVKDHLAHLAVWEESLVALLDGLDEMAAIGLTPGETDEENERLRQLYAPLPLTEVRQLAERTHARLIERLAAMSDADLARPYSAFRPGVERPDKDNPISGWIDGNTWEHFDEHREWIAAMPLRKSV